LFKRKWSTKYKHATSPRLCGITREWSET